MKKSISILSFNILIILGGIWFIGAGMTDTLMLYFEMVVLLLLFCLSKQKQAKFFGRKHKRFAYALLFVMAFTMYLVKLLIHGNMIVESGDATSIWQTITTYYSENMQSSYVLYKGLFSVYPYVWLYRLACSFGTNEFFFIMIYNACLWAYVVAVGMPNIFQRLFDKESPLWKCWLFVIIVFNLQIYNFAYLNISVDIPSMFCFILMMDMGIRIWKDQKQSYLLEILLLGITAGAVFCFSGQYILAGMMGIVFVVIAISKKKKIRQTIFCVVVIVICVFGAKTMDHRFNISVVEPMREAGEWIPTGEEWIVAHLYSTEPSLGYAYLSKGDLRDMQVMQIFLEEKLQYKWEMTADEVIVEYFGAMLRHPVEYLISCGNKLFLAFCIDAGEQYRFLSLGVGFGLFFIGMMKIIQRYIGNIRLAKVEYFIGLAFFLTILVPCALHMELRYAMTIQNFVFGFGIFGTDSFRSIECQKNKREHRMLFDKRVLGKILGCILFVMFCFMHYMALLD